MLIVVVDDCCGLLLVVMEKVGHSWMRWAVAGNLPRVRTLAAAIGRGWRSAVTDACGGDWEWMTIGRGYGRSRLRLDVADDRPSRALAAAIARGWQSATVTDARGCDCVIGHGSTDADARGCDWVIGRGYGCSDRPRDARGSDSIDRPRTRTLTAGRDWAIGRVNTRLYQPRWRTRLRLDVAGDRPGGGRGCDWA